MEVCAGERFLSRGLIADLQSVAGSRVVIQGFGNVGLIAAQAFFEMAQKSLPSAIVREVYITRMDSIQGNRWHL